MEETLEILPQRPKPTGKLVLAGNPIKLCTNLYQISLRRSPDIYQYTIVVQPQVEDHHAVSLFRNLLLSKKQILKNEIGFLTSRGRVIWGTKMAQKAPNFKIAKNVQKGILNDYQILIKHTRSIAYADFSSITGDYFRQIQQVYIVALRQKMLKMGFQQNIKNRFVQKGDGIIVKEYNILDSFELKLVPVMKKMNLLIDCGFRLLNQRNALQQLQERGNKEAQKEHAVGKIVVTIYNNRSYRVTGICFDSTPRSQFYNLKRGKKMTYQEYFKEYYQITPLSYNQPLFETIINVKYEKKGETKTKIQTKGYLIPQFCKFAATLNSIKGENLISFKQVSSKIKITPQERRIRQRNLISQINNQKEGQFQVAEKSTQVNAFVYQDITVIGKKTKLCDMGLFKDMKLIKEPRDYNKEQILFVYSNTIKNSKGQYKNACSVFKQLAFAAEHYNIIFQGAEYLEVNSSYAGDWIQTIDIQFSRYPKLRKTIRIVVLLFDYLEKNHYGALKKYITNQLVLPCQVILKKTTVHKNKTSILGKIALQMNAKCGKTLWSVQMKHPFWAKKIIAYGAFSVSKNVKKDPKKKKGVEAQIKKGDVLGFVGTTSEDLTKTYSNAILVEKSAQLKTAKPFQELLVEWIKNFKLIQKTFPEIIVIYREGLADNQIKAQTKAEIEGLQNAIKRAKSKYPNYDPQIIYILVSKRSSKRVYLPERTQGSGKFAPITMQNPLPGTIVFESISSQEVYDFHLMAQNINQGTATLTNYHVAYDASRIPQQAIAQFTMQQCYNYPNWQGGISVPSCLQSADRLSKLVGDHIHQNITDKIIEYGDSIESIRNKPFYL